MAITRSQVSTDITNKITSKTAAGSLSNTDDGANRELILDYVDQQLPYKSYTALLTQAGTAAPTAYIAKNDANLTVTFTRNSSGNFTGTMPSGYVAGKTTIITGSCSVETIFTAAFQNTTIIALRTFVNQSGTNTFYDDELNSTFFEIRIYN